MKSPKAHGHCSSLLRWTQASHHSFKKKDFFCNVEWEVIRESTTKNTHTNVFKGADSIKLCLLLKFSLLGSRFFWNGHLHIRKKFIKIAVDPTDFFFSHFLFFFFQRRCWSFVKSLSCLLAVRPLEVLEVFWRMFPLPSSQRQWWKKPSSVRRLIRPLSVKIPEPHVHATKNFLSFRWY